MKTTQIMCDACGTILRGSKGIEQINKSNLGIRGAIVFFTEEGEYIHITKHAQEELSFCDTECFKKFCNYRIEEKEKWRKEQLMREASDRIVYNEM